MDQNLKVRVLTPKEILFEGEASSVSSKNHLGKFDILPYHARFISFIENQPIIIKQPNQKAKDFRFPFAIIYNSDNKVDIFTEIALSRIE